MRTIKYINQVSLVFPSRSANEGFARSAAASFAAAASAVPAPMRRPSLRSFPAAM